MKYSGPMPFTCTKCDYYKRLISEYCERIAMSNSDKLKNATPRSLRSMTKQEMEDLRTNCLIKDWASGDVLISE